MTDASAPRTAPVGRVDSLTGIRSLAALLVCATHAAFWTGKYTDNVEGWFFARLEVGVAIFFVLSGYLLFTPWVTALRKSGAAPDVGRYFWHRARRILPAYWLTVLGVYLVFVWKEDNSTLGHGTEGLVRNLTLTQTYGFGYLHSGLTHMWSLATEVVFYLLLPAFGWVISRLCGGRWCPGVMIGAVIVLMLVSPAWAVATHHIDGLDVTARLWAPAFLIWFAGGMLLAILGQLMRNWHPLLSVLVAVLAFQLSCTSLAGEPTITPNSLSATIVKSVLYLVIAVGLIAPLAIGSRDHWWSRAMSRPAVVWFGEISYEFFLVHLIVLELVMDMLGYPIFSGSVVGVFIVTVVLATPVAWALHQVTAPLWHKRKSAVVSVR
ncbi:acyltransferase family protein [Williamsia muralis]|uniref:Acyltransferase n=1 Tax=Williamsia marianensis TaxID=85044 RepID=A0A2G3PPP6_WILMA|nr:acyltransferase [Williamsia marianensis]PHV67052.1 acyltransferase [Williamsia marianensis]